MRISDWSSDVCSSDLQLRPDYLERVYRDRATAFDRVSRLFTSVNPDLPLQRGFARVMAGDRLVKSVADAQAAGAVSLHFRDGAVGATIEEIGRGSCRERVCHYG